ncbi:MAG: hypothetical protein BGN96_17615 [Bacteroidales bacterium 45-6]|nr:MAG: hypothetical protein BGN96_17615 [Bacteroidales bacterium 45-6]
MHIIGNKRIPFRGFQAINLFGIVFARRECLPLSAVTINHEKIHTQQMRELAFFPFYLLYVAEWMFKSIRRRSFRQGYLSISFEREAYANQEDLSYLEKRKRWGFVKYM